MHIDVEWDAAKAAANVRKHRVSFEEASTALLDPRALAQEDVSSDDEHRWVLVGMSVRARLLTLVYTLRRADRIRLISARSATRKEAEFYAKGT
ncbi:BrnT family toxin [Lentisalinibacter sediminis]|uniref:BrnT family toxin n=1 Tax=Lentisalinibacter sediminis TaxID=2992237 RepID=UPI0038698EA6